MVLPSWLSCANIVTVPGTKPGSNTGKAISPIPRQTPEELHLALKRLSQLTDLVLYQDWIGRKTKDGDRPGPEPWTYTRQYAVKQMPGVAPEEVIRLFTEAGAENDVEAMFHVVNNMHLIP